MITGRGLDLPIKGPRPEPTTRSIILISQKQKDVAPGQLTPSTTQTSSALPDDLKENPACGTTLEGRLLYYRPLSGPAVVTAGPIVC